MRQSCFAFCLIFFWVGLLVDLLFVLWIFGFFDNFAIAL